jgi:dihydroorotate dehydrogenase electron transfer subunit
VGKGTKLLSTVREGEALDIIGPLGRGYDTGINGKRAVLIGGGLGIAPLFFLGRELAPNNHVQALFGGRNKDAIPRFSSIKSFTYELITEDGSLGSKGLVTDLLVKLLEEDKPDIIYSCGPRPMLAAVNKIALQYNIPHQVSLESVMACGVGACLGCTCKGTSKGTNEEKIDEKNDEIGNNGDKADVLLKVCKDGPVFWAGEVQWE